MAKPSYYFTLYKKFQVLGHVPASTVHGAGAGGFNLTNPHAVFGSSDAGALLGSTTDPALSPLWAVLNSRAMGNPGFTSVTVNGVSWPTMPDGANDASPPSWAEFQVNAPSPKLVTVLADWITSGKVDDVPDDVLGQMPPTQKRLENGVIPFVCNMPGDDGTTPVPDHYWATSLIFLVDPNTGNTVSPSHLAGGDEYFLTAIIGNRGTDHGGRYAKPAAGPKIEADAHVMVWNSGFSPAVRLPALSNLDIAATAPVYESYFLRSGQYDVVGFRLPVQAVFDGLVAAVASADIDLGGATAADWVRHHPAHLCARVRVRRANQSWPSLSDSPQIERRIAQNNLAPFAVNLTVQDPDPAIEWFNFLAGDTLRLWRFHEAWGALRMSVNTTLRRDQADIYLAIPRLTFERLDANQIKGFKEQPNAPGLHAPFPQCAILRYRYEDNAVQLPRLGEHELLAMSLGIRPHRARMQPGVVGQVSLRQEATFPRIEPGRDAFQDEWRVTGGLTVAVRAYANEWRGRAVETGRG